MVVHKIFTPIVLENESKFDASIEIHLEWDPMFPFISEMIETNVSMKLTFISRGSFPITPINVFKDSFRKFDWKVDGKSAFVVYEFDLLMHSLLITY